MVTDRSGEVGRPDLTRPMGRLGPWMAAIWLFFLISPVTEGWQQRDRTEGVLGVVATVLFGAVYLYLWVRARSYRQRLLRARVTLREGLPVLVLLLVLGAAMVLTLGEPGLACVVYLAVSGVLIFRLEVAATLAVLLAGGTVVLGDQQGWGSQWGLAFSTLAAFLAVFGISSMMRRNMDLIRAHEENARLAVENERIRFARDLHDILGHSLTVITVKAELAGRLLDLDPEGARREVADLERLARDALADCREAVEGYRGLTLPRELVRARQALSAANIEADLPNSTDEVPTELRELFAWTVREGVTNVIRHSGARRCSIALAQGSMEVRDDGAGCAEPVDRGNGLRGLRERASAHGATVLTSSLEPGFRLAVSAR